MCLCVCLHACVHACVCFACYNYVHHYSFRVQLCIQNIAGTTLYITGQVPMENYSNHIMLKPCWPCLISVAPRLDILLVSVSTLWNQGSILWNLEKLAFDENEKMCVKATDCDWHIICFISTQILKTFICVCAVSYTHLRAHETA